ncbi:DUF2946 family protein [Stappia sp.]|jgi:hypothetical protein|uniref:DUF2946 family protein n=1 Tax=Stappia sp. TaxID=1870903 RepID=UPI003A98CFD5
MKHGGQSRRAFGNRSFRPELTLALVVLLVLSSLMPRGMMPGRDADGHISVVLCTSEGLRTVLLDASGREVEEPLNPDDPDERHASLCVFAPVVTALAAADISFDLPAPPASAPTRELQPAAFHPHWQGLPLGARAPPRLLTL